MINFLRRQYYRLKKYRLIYKQKKATYLINCKYAGVFSEKAFKIKANAMRCLGCFIEDGVTIVGPIFITAKVWIGANTHIGKNCSFEGGGNVKIGKNCDIAPNVVFSTGGHIIGNKIRRAGYGLNYNIEVGDGTWIGNRVTIIKDTTIGKGNVVAAGSVVVQSTPDNVLIAGVPAKIKKDLD